MRKHELIVGIAGALVAGFGAVVLSRLPLKWAGAAIVLMALVAILFIVRDAQRPVLFVLSFALPFHIGSGIPPFLVHAGYVGLADSSDLQFIDILVLALVLHRLARWATQRVEIRLYPFTTVPACAWLGVSALSALNASEVDVSVIQISQMVKLVLLYLVVANSIQEDADLKWLLQGLLLGVLFQAFLGSYQWLTGHPLGVSFLGEPARLVDVRTVGTIGAPNGYGMFLAAALPAGLASLFLGMRRLLKALIGIVLCAGFFGLIFSLSRGAWLGFGVASIVVLLFAYRRRRQNLQMAFLGGVSILLILLVLTYSQRDLIGARLADRQANESALSRITMNQGAIAMIQDHPVLGVGLNNYSLWMPKYDPFDYAQEQRIVIVHNIYLLIAAETGIVGLAAFLWFLWALLLQAWRLIGPASNDTVWWAGVAAFSAFAALAVHGLVDYGLLANEPLFRLVWLFAALAAGAGASLLRERDVITRSLVPETGNA